MRGENPKQLLFGGDITKLVDRDFPHKLRAGLPLLTRQQMNQAVQWCEEQWGPRAVVAIDPQESPVPYAYDPSCRWAFWFDFRFKTEQDAAIFKLWWF